MNARKIIKLWYFRQEVVLTRLYKELHDCRCTLHGGAAGASVSKYLGASGAVYWVRDGRGTQEQWREYRRDLREYAIGRIAMLLTRIEKVEGLQPPTLPESTSACPRCTRGYIRCYDPECAICASDNDPDCPNATRCPDCA